MNTTRTIMLLPALLLLLLAGCASAPVKAERYFWPPSPEQPRIEWIGSYANQLELKGPGALSALVGEEDPVGIKNPMALAADGKGKVYVTDQQGKNVMVFDLVAKNVHILGGGAANVEFVFPSGIDLDEAGNIYVGDITKKEILVFDPSEKPIRTIGLADKVKSVGFFAIDRAAKRIVIPDIRGHKLVITDYDGKVLKEIERYPREVNPKDFKDAKDVKLEKRLKDGKEIYEVQDGFSYPNAVAIDKKGTLIVADTNNARLLRLTPEGEYLSMISKRGDAIGDINMAKSVAVDSEGHIYLADFRAARVQIHDEKGQTLLAFGQYSLDPRRVGGFYAPGFIYIDRNDAIYVLDKMAKRFHVFQYLNDAWLAAHPIKEEEIAKPVMDEGKKGEKKGTGK